MNRDKQRLPDYLGHILEAIERIDRYTKDMDDVTFLQNEMAQDAVIRNLDHLRSEPQYRGSLSRVCGGSPGIALGVRLSDAQRRGTWVFQSRPGDRMEDGPERPGVVVRTGAGLCKRKVITRSHVTTSPENMAPRVQVHPRSKP
ncbi:MAG: HepT-like ribonuclease domain-containing protein [Candidatus Dechloromonas phosphoritropha]